MIICIPSWIVIGFSRGLYVDYEANGPLAEYVSY
jgi:hypothetical protein